MYIHIIHTVYPYHRIDVYTQTYQLTCCPPSPRSPEPAVRARTRGVARIFWEVGGRVAQFIAPGCGALSNASARSSMRHR